MTQTKKCRKCGEIKPIENFSKSKGYLDGFKSACKKCEYEIAKENKTKKEKVIFDNALCQQFLRGAYGWWLRRLLGFSLRLIRLRRTRWRNPQARSPLRLWLLRTTRLTRPYLRTHSPWIGNETGHFFGQFYDDFIFIFEVDNLFFCRIRAWSLVFGSQIWYFHSQTTLTQ